MKEKDFEAKMNEIQEKIGKDASSLILDDIAILLNDNKQMNETMGNQTKENESLKKTNETLQRVNGNLLQQISMGTDDQIINTKETKKEEKKQDFDFRNVFDENRKF